MSQVTYLDFQPIMDDPFPLSDRELDDPQRVFLNFFAGNALAETRCHLAILLEVCATTNNEPFESAEMRRKLFLLHHGLERIVTAAFLLAKRVAAEELDQYE